VLCCAALKPCLGAGSRRTSSSDEVGARQHGAWPTSLTHSMLIEWWRVCEGRSVGRLEVVALVCLLYDAAYGSLRNTAQREKQTVCGRL
jgi:hypothetical protein